MRYAESDGRFNYATPSGKGTGALIVWIPEMGRAAEEREEGGEQGVPRRANDGDKGGDEGVGRWGDRVADYARDFHNIRRLKFSHNIADRARRHDKRTERRNKSVRTRRKRGRKEQSKKEK